MKAPSTEEVVYKYMFPKPKITDPQNFQSFLQKHLVIEVRQETHTFYGSLDSREAQYPGLDYSHPPHQARLKRFQWHRRMFRAFDALGLTKHEIAGLTKWEGTRWAKEQYERESGQKIRDTTGEGITNWVEPRDRKPRSFISPRAHDVDVEVICGVNDGAESDEMDEDGEEEEEEDEEEVEDSDVEVESIGFELNQRLRTAAAAREAGNSSTVMDAAYEQWLKERAENGSLNFLPDQPFPLSRPLSTATARSARALHAEYQRFGRMRGTPPATASTSIHSGIHSNHSTETATMVLPPRHRARLITATDLVGSSAIVRPSM